jgi:hypothetical protein
MHHTELSYRRELHGLTRRRFAELIGRDYQTLAKWETGETELPPWLADWLEYMDMELIRGRTPQRLPRSLRAIREILYPAQVAAEDAARRPRRPNGVNDALHARRRENRTLRQQQRDNHLEMERNRGVRFKMPWET